MILLDYEECRAIRKKQIFLDPYPSADRENNMVSAGAQAQLKKVAQYLEDNGVRFVKDEWEAIGHGGYYEIEWAKFEALLKEAGLKEE